MIELYKNINKINNEIIFSNKKMRENNIHEIMMQKKKNSIIKINEKNINLFLRYEILNKTILIILYILF